MENKEVAEMPDFTFTPEGFRKLESVLKAGKIVRNPFPKFYGNGATVTVIKTGELAGMTRRNDHAKPE
jgi:hypothetical protein